MSPKSRYIHDMPYLEREKLRPLLDVDGHWKTLGGLMGFTSVEIHYMEYQEHNISPTEQILRKWGTQNHTVQELFYLLFKMKHYQAMLTLKDLVDENHHRLIFEGRTLSELINGSNDCSGGQSLCTGNVATSPTSVDTSEKYDGRNLNVMMPENQKFSKAGFGDSDKIQNIGAVSIEANSPQPHSPGAAYSPSGLTPKIAVEGLKHPQLSPAGEEAIAAAGPSKIANAIQNIDLGVTSPARRKLSDVSMGSIQSECVLPMLEYKELELATNKWSKVNILGKGGFGTVYKGVWKNTEVAIKRLEVQKGESQESSEVSYQQSQRELQALQRYHHKNILQLYGLSLDGNHPCLIYQFMENGSLEDRLQCKKNTAPLTWSQRNNIAKGAARGLQFLHTVEKQPLIHGDIKSANILLDMNLEPRIGDFGLAREGPQSHYTSMKVSKVHGTRPYLPDEYLRSKTLSKKVDTYSFGVVLFELGTGLRAYDDKRDPRNRYLREEVLSRKNVLELMDPKGRADFMVSQSQRSDVTNVSMLSIDSRILEGLLIFCRLMDAGKKCVNKQPKDRPDMQSVCQTLDQHTSPADVTAIELQILYDKIHDLHVRMLHGSGSQPNSGEPVNSVPLASGQPSPMMSVNTPGRPSGQVNGQADFNDQISPGRQVSNFGGSNRPSTSSISANPNQPLLGDRLASAKAVDGVPSPSGIELPGLSKAFDMPSIAIMPPTASDVSNISSRSSQSESSDYTSHDSHPTSAVLSRDLESPYEEQGHEIYPLLTILGNKSSSDAEETSQQIQGSELLQENKIPACISSPASS